MGFYDCRCMVTGVSLKGAGAVLVMLEGTNGTFLPAALAIKGTYNRLGAIDTLEEDENVALIEDYLRRQLQAGEFIVQHDYLEPGSDYEQYKAEWFLEVLERNINDDPETALLNHQPLSFALICQSVWQSLVGSQLGVTAAPEEDLLRELFDGRTMPYHLYNAHLPAVRTQLLELHTMSAFLSARGIPWAVTEAGGQDDAEEMQAYLQLARATFAGCVPVLQGLEAYAREVEDLLTED